MSESNAAFRFDDKMNFDFHAPRRVRVEPESALRAAVAYEFIRRLAEVPIAYRFKHALMQDAAYTSLTLHERRRLHGITAHVLESAAGAALDDISAQLAQHYAAAGDAAKTLVYATRAGDRALQLHALDEAIKFYQQALDSTQHTDTPSLELIHLFTNRGRAFELKAQFDNALSNYQEMETVAHNQSDHHVELESYLLRANLHATATSVHAPVEAQQLAERGLLLARELGDRPAECKALWNLLVTCRYAGQTARAIHFGEQALALARELGLTEQLAFVLGDLGGVYTIQGDLARANAFLEEATPLWRSLDNKPMLADNLMLSGVQALLSGAFDKTVSLTEEGAQVSQQIGNLMGQASNHATQATVWLERGDMAEALRLGVENTHIAEQMGLDFVLLQSRSALALAYAEVGAFARAQALAELAGAPKQQAMPDFFLAWGFAILAQAYLLCENFPAAERALMTSRNVQSPGSAASPGRHLGLIAEAQLALVNGKPEHAAGLMANSKALLQSEGIRLFLGEVLYVEALALRAQGASASAAEVLQQARAEAEFLQSRRLLWRIDHALSELERAAGNVLAADAYREQARVTIGYIVAHTPPEFRASFLNMPQVSQVLA